MVLDALEQQSYDHHDFEVVVVDDGGSDGTYQDIQGKKDTYTFSLKVLTQVNQGQGIARNHGIREASGDVILLLGDDSIPEKDTLAEHMRVHEMSPEENVGVLGFTTWHKDIPFDHFRYFLENGGQQFAYYKLADAQYWKGDKSLRLADYQFFYTINISFKKSMFMQEMFDESFHAYGWEDIELGYRLEKKHDFKLVYNRLATTGHYHPITIDDFSKRMYTTGTSLLLFHDRHSEVPVYPAWYQKWIAWITPHFAMQPVMKYLGQFFLPALYFYFYLVMKQGYFNGIWDGEQERKLMK